MRAPALPRTPERRSLLTSAAVVVAALYFAQEVLIPMALGVLLSFLLAPLATRLERWKLGRITSVLTVVAVAFLAIGALGWVVGRQVLQLATDLPRYQDEIVHKAERLRGAGPSVGANIERLGEELDRATKQPSSKPAVAAPPTTSATALVSAAVEQVSRDPVHAIASEAVGGPPKTASSPAGTTPANPVFTVPLPAPVSPIKTLGTYVGLVLGPLSTAALVLIFVIFILLEREDLRDRLIQLVSSGKYTLTTRALDDATSRITRYMVAQTIVNGFYGLIVAVGLWVIGLTAGHGTGFPSFVLWGLLCAILRFIPYVGPWLALSFPVALSLAVYPGFTVFGLTVGLLVLLELVINNVVEPWLYGTSTGISTVALLVAAVFWTWLWGPVGLLLATPLTVCFAVIGRHVPQLRFLDVMLGDRPPLPPSASYYQRLLADDNDEARKVLVKRSAEQPERLADDVLIPALLMARRDRRRDRLSSETESAVLAATAEHLASPDISFGCGVGSGRVVDLSVTVVGCPAHHASEELVVTMLARMLESPGGARMEATSTRLLPSEVEAVVDRTQPAVVFIAVLPPGGLDQARHLCKRLRKRFPNLWIVLGFWGRTRNFDALLVRLRKAGASYVTTSMHQTVNQIRALLSTNDASPSSGATPIPNEPRVTQ